VFHYFAQVKIINVMIGTNLKPHPWEEVAAYAAGEGKRYKVK
jgi:hypothetical protein